ncbi:myeloid leukemia factor 1-like [Saccoglossus kowalevskii]|uniref:Myeloid leukemia factor 1-like n=1 Tax=Saccoglossus kowalevskii TaxID=10224 RepID=A0ABM0GQ13_SACKO|nr:PREDICTED: myeloid leukemia factor 1-like [Saccoglossus kowalevskii]
MLRGFGGFDDDPFFADFREQHRQINSMFDNFGFGSMLHRDPFMALTDGRTTTGLQQRHNRHPGGSAMAPFGMFDDMFANMNNMMTSMHQNFDRGISTNPNAHTYSQSSVMTYSNVGDGAPKVYQASSSTRTAPGGIKETRNSVRDSQSGTERMAVGRHIGERGHIVEKSRNRRTREEEEHQEFLNLDEDEAPQFNNEWRDKAYASRSNRSVTNGYGGHHRNDRPRNQYAAITEGRENSSRDRSPLRYTSERTHHSQPTQSREHIPPRPTGPSKKGRAYKQ